MAKVPATRRSYARLNFEDGEVLVTPRDRSIFMISAEKAIEACRKAMLREEGLERFESEFLVPLHDWCVAHADRVRACYIPMPGANVPVFIVTLNPRFDFDLAEEMAALERKLARSGWRVGVTQLPRTDHKTQATFFHFEGALEVYAQRGSAPQKSGKQS
jgi:hypothetical protein